MARRSKLATKQANADDIALVNSISSKDASNVSTATTTTTADAAAASLSYEELDKKIAETEALNEAVGLQIDSVLQNLDKKGVSSTDKQRMRVIMAALTAENMRLDLLVNICCLSVSFVSSRPCLRFADHQRCLVAAVRACHRDKVAVDTCAERRG
jgi:hypothetical protein